MRKGFKILTILAAAAGAAVLADGVMANCQESNGYPINNCGARAYFAPPPAGSGPVSGSWWQLSFGNATHNTDPNNLANSSPTGTSFQAGRGWIGNDNGLRVSLEDLDLVDAGIVGGPPGSLCFSSGSSWGPPGIDGCADNARSGLGAYGQAKNDNILNPYYRKDYGAGYYSLNYQIDNAMAVLLTEGSGNHFALAMFATEPRPARESDQDPGVGFNMGFISNGDANPNVPGQNNIIPWQPIPQPFISATLVNPADPNSNRLLSMSWPSFGAAPVGQTPLRLITDNSSRPSTDTTLAPGQTGVGVNDQGTPLWRHLVETAPITDTGTLACGTFAAVAATETQGTSASLTVPANTCVRLATLFGRKPQVTTTTGPTASVGRLGDLGYLVRSRHTHVGGPLVAERAELKVAQRSKGHLQVSWETSTELTLTGFDIVGKDGKGERVLAHKACSQCNNGLSASYSELIPAANLKGSKSVVIVMQPSGTRSNEVSIQ